MTLCSGKEEEINSVMERGGGQQEQCYGEGRCTVEDERKKVLEISGAMKWGGEGEK